MESRPQSRPIESCNDILGLLDSLPACLTRNDPHACEYYLVLERPRHGIWNVKYVDNGGSVLLNVTMANLGRALWVLLGDVMASYPEQIEAKHPMTVRELLERYEGR